MNSLIEPSLIAFLLFISGLSLIGAGIEFYNLRLKPSLFLAGLSVLIWICVMNSI